MTSPTTLTNIIHALQESDAHLAFLARSRTEVVPHRELHGLVTAAAADFRWSGVKSGDRVLVQLDTDLISISAFLGLVYLGAVPVSVKPPPPAGHPDGYLMEVASQQGAHFALDLDDIEGCATLVPGRHPDMNGIVPIDAAPDETAFVQYSSGSTGDPRPVAVTHGALCANLEAIARFDRRSPASVGFNCLPLHHDMGLVGGLLSCLAVRHSLLLTDVRSFLRRPIGCLEVAARMGATVTAMPTFLLDYLARSLSRVRSPSRELLASYTTIYCGAEPIRAATIEEFLAAGVPAGLHPEALAFCYGLAEATLLVTGHRFGSMADSFDTHRSLKPLACVGTPLGGAEVKIVGNTESCDDDVGRLHIRGPSVFAGYRGGRDYSVDWFDTGDLAYLRDGRLFICGRGTDSLVINGENIFVADIESHILGWTGVEECVVLPDDGGFYVYVVAGRQATMEPEALSTGICRAVGVAPRGIHYGSRAGISRTTSGKPVRHAMLSRLKTMTGAWAP